MGKFISLPFFFYALVWRIKLIYLLLWYRKQNLTTMSRSQGLQFLRDVYRRFVLRRVAELLLLPVGTSMVVAEGVALFVRDEGLAGRPELFIEDAREVIGGRLSVIRPLSSYALEEQVAWLVAVDDSTLISVKEF